MATSVSNNKIRNNATMKGKGSGNSSNHLRKNNPNRPSVKDKINLNRPPQGNLTRRLSLDIQPSATDSPRKNSNDSVEIKSILKNKTTRRSSVALGDLPRSTEFEQIMESLLTTKLSIHSSSDTLDNASTFSGKLAGCVETLNNGSSSDSGSDKDIVKSSSYRLETEREGSSSSMAAKRVTFCDNVSSLPST